jgi:hypothetical protein
MKIRNLVFCTLLFCPILANAVTDKPNIVLVFLDNFGWGEPGFNGGGIIRGAPTPRIDQIAAEGLRLTNFNVEVQCTPSRSALMTGRYAIRSGNGTVPLGEGVYGLVQWEVTMAEMLSAAGYATGMYGKWHLGRTEGRFPTDQGFDEWYGIPNSTDESVYSEMPGFAESGVAESYVMEGQKGSAPKKVRPYRLDYRPLIDRDLTDRAIDFMQRQAQADKPFFVYLPYTATHFPTMPHPDFVGKTGNGAWADLLAQIDSYTGELLDTLDDRRQRPGSARLREHQHDRRNGNARLAGTLAQHAVHELRGRAARPLRRALAGQDRCRQVERRNSACDGPVPDAGEDRRRRGADRPSHRRRRDDGFLPRPVRKIGPRGIRRLPSSASPKNRAARDSSFTWATTSSASSGATGSCT